MKQTSVVSKRNLTIGLIAANKILAFQNEENEKYASELMVANTALKKADEEHQKEYIKWLEEMLFMTSHRVRQPIARIIGVSTLLDTCVSSPDELKRMTGYMKQSAQSLDNLTRELTTFIYEKENQVKSNCWL